MKIFESMETGPLQVNCYLLGDREAGEAVVIDPGDNADRILRRLGQLGLTLVGILATHGHFDHIGGAEELQRETGAPFHIHPADHELLAIAPRQAAMWGLRFGRTPHPDRELRHEQTLQLAGHSLTVIHTPGHSPGGVSFLAEDRLFVGDTLFQGSIGRTDFPGGDYDQLIEMVRARIFTLPDPTTCYPGHGPDTTVGREKRSNPFFA